jgi:hypothetical protein
MARFSLSTLLICIFVAAVVLSYCMNVPATKQGFRTPPLTGEVYFYKGVPQPKDIAWRLLWAEPLAMVATLLAIQGVRKIWQSIPHKSKAPN